MILTYDELVSTSIERLVPYYLMSSYLYYERDLNIFSDEEYDKLCFRLLDNYDKIKHPHLKLIDTESLRCGTGYTLEYPNIVRHAGNLWYAAYVKIRSEQLKLIKKC